VTVVTSRPTTVSKGRSAEDRAVNHLVAQGYEIVARNVRRAGGEIDVIAHDGDTLCFIEVRSRKSARFGTPASTIDAKKQARIARAASSLLASWAGPIPRCRFDVVTITGEGDACVLEVIRSAFAVGI
jgi:putative endonuclease